jgi:glutathione synthase/RimK-type ligase-like ATP-grasp enzyme
MSGIHFWYSFSTDVTGKALAEEVAKKLPGKKVTSGNSMPENGCDVLVGWGAKPKKDFDYSSPVKLSGSIINNVKEVRNAANKLKALELLSSKGVSVPPFVPASTINQAIANGKIKFPMFGRSKRHEKGTGTWECWQGVDVEDALKDVKNGKTADYFVQFIPNKREFRIHVFKDAIIQSCEKVWQNNPPAAFKLLKKELYKKRAEKAGVTLNESTIDFVIDQIIKDDISLPNNHSRHNTKGWKFSFLATEKTPSAIRKVSVDAVKALGLDFGAVDCILGEDNQAYVIEVNTGPGLCASMLDKYAKTFANYLAETKLNTANAVQSTTKIGATAKNTSWTPKQKSALCDAFGLDETELEIAQKVIKKFVS